jgi:spermidine/putrescine transport system permease protein
LPALTTVAVPQFLNNNSNGSMISDIIIQEGMIALNSAIALARTSTLSLVLSVFLLATFGFFKLLLFLNKKRVLKRKEKNV